jgi:hypothetical protein
VSALDHVLDGAATVPPDRGLFLTETWRLAPARRRRSGIVMQRGGRSCSRVRRVAVRSFEGGLRKKVRATPLTAEIEGIRSICVGGFVMGVETNGERRAAKIAP